MEPSNILQRLSDGNINNIVSEVKAALAGPGHSTLARRALSRICNLCVACNGRTEPVVKDDEEALHLALLCSEAIQADTTEDEKIQCDARVMKSVHGILARFCMTGNILFFVKVLAAYLPLFKKMAPFVQEADCLLLNKYFSLVGRLLHSASDTLFKENSPGKIGPIDVLTVVLQLRGLVAAAKSTSLVLDVMKHLSIKNQEYNQQISSQKIENFNLDSLRLLGTHCNKFKFPCLVAKEDDEDQLFVALLTCIWQYLQSDLSLCMAKNWDFILQSFSSLAYSYLTLNERHLSYFNLVTEIYGAFNLVQCTSEEVFCLKLQSVLSFMRSHEVQGNPLWVLHSGKCAVNTLATFAESAPCRSLLSPRALSLVFEFVKIVSESFLSCDTSCFSDDNEKVCQHQGDTFKAFRTSETLVRLCSKLKRGDQGEWSELFPLIQNSIDLLEKCCNKATTEKCFKSELLRASLGSLCCIIGSICYKFQSWKDGQVFLLRSCKYMFAGYKETSSFLQELTTVLQNLSLCCDKQGLYKDARVAVLLAIVLNLKNCTSFHVMSRHQWRHLQNEDPTGSYSLVQVAEQELIFLKSIWPDFYIDAKDLPSILVWELSCYACHRMKSSDIILRAWAALKSTKASCLSLLEGSALACQGLFLCCDTVWWYDLVGGSISSWLSQVQGDEKPAALCAVAVHYYARFLIQAQSHFDENESKVVEVQPYTHNPATVRQPLDVVNKDDVCQVRSHFANLNLKREEKLMELLESSMNYWKDSLHAGLSAGDYEKHEVVAASGEYLLQTAYLYVLWGYHAGAANAFQLCREFAKKMCRDDLLLQALSGLMSTIEVSHNFILEAEKLVETLKDQPKSSDLFKIYYASRAFQALRTNSHAEGYTALRNVLDFDPSASTMWCYGYTKFLEASYTSLDKMKMAEAQFNACSGLTRLIRHIQGKRLSHSPLIFAGLLNQVFSLALWVGRYYLKRQMPREARGYLKLELVVALKLGLATRAAEFICELAFVDLLTENVDETVAKISDLQSILGQTDASAPTDGATDDDVLEADELLVDGLNRLGPKKEAQTLCPSPNLNEGEFSIPLIKHKSFCQCYSCKNCSIQNLWLMTAHLQAKIYTLRFFANKSSEIYQQCLKAVRKVLHQPVTKVHSPERLLQQHQVACTEIGLRLDFVDFLVMYGKDDRALVENKNVFDLLKNLSTSEMLLMAEALEQKISIINIIQKAKRIQNGQMSSKSLARKASVSPRVFSDKTPERKMDCLTPIPPGKNKRQPFTPLKAVSNRLPAHQKFVHLKANLDLSPNIDETNKFREAPKKTRDASRKKVELNHAVSSKSSFSNRLLEEVNGNAKSGALKFPVQHGVSEGQQGSMLKQATQAKPKPISSQVPTRMKLKQERKPSPEINLEDQVTKPEKAESLKLKKTVSSKPTSGPSESSRRATRSTCLKKM